MWSKDDINAVIGYFGAPEAVLSFIASNDIDGTKITEIIQSGKSGSSGGKNSFGKGAANNNNNSASSTKATNANDDHSHGKIGGKAHNYNYNLLSSIDNFEGFLTFWSDVTLKGLSPGFFIEKLQNDSQTAEKYKIKLRRRNNADKDHKNKSDNNNDDNSSSNDNNHENEVQGDNKHSIDSMEILRLRREIDELKQTLVAQEQLSLDSNKYIVELQNVAEQCKSQLWRTSNEIESLRRQLQRERQLKQAMLHLAEECESRYMKYEDEIALLHATISSLERKPQDVDRSKIGNIEDFLSVDDNSFANITADFVGLGVKQLNPSLDPSIAPYLGFSPPPSMNVSKQIHSNSLSHSNKDNGRSDNSNNNSNNNNNSNSNNNVTTGVKDYKSLLPGGGHFEEDIRIVDNDTIKASWFVARSDFEVYVKEPVESRSVAEVLKRPASTEAAYVSNNSNSNNDNNNNNNNDDDDYDDGNSKNYQDTGNIANIADVIGDIKSKYKELSQRSPRFQHSRIYKYELAVGNESSKRDITTTVIEKHTPNHVRALKEKEEKGADGEPVAVKPGRSSATKRPVSAGVNLRQYQHKQVYHAILPPSSDLQGNNNANIEVVETGEISNVRNEKKMYNYVQNNFVYESREKGVIYSSSNEDVITDIDEGGTKKKPTMKASRPQSARSTGTKNSFKIGLGRTIKPQLTYLHNDTQRDKTSPRGNKKNTAAQSHLNIPSYLHIPAYYKITSPQPEEEEEEERVSPKANRPKSPSQYDLPSFYTKIRRPYTFKDALGPKLERKREQMKEQYIQDIIRKYSSAQDYQGQEIGVGQELEVHSGDNRYRDYYGDNAASGGLGPDSALLLIMTGNNAKMGGNYPPQGESAFQEGVHGKEEEFKL